MKRSFYIFLFLFLMTFLNGCNWLNPTITSGETTKHVLPEQVYNVSDVLETYAEGVSFQGYTYNTDYNLPEIYMDVTFTNITYSPIQNKISMTFDVHDTGWENASYFVLLQERTKTTSIQQIKFYGTGRDFSSSAEFKIEDRSKDYRILIGKYDLDNPDRVWNYIEGSVWIEWEDANWQDRATFNLTSHTDETEEVTSDLTQSYAAFKFIIDDASHCIEFLDVLIYEPSGSVIDIKTYTAENYRMNDNIIVSGSFDSLSPNVDYIVQAFVAGNDGFDDFTEIFVVRIDVHSAKLPGQTDYYYTVNFHGLYMVIYNIEYTETEAILSYIYFNEEKISFSDNEEILYLHLEYFDDSGDFISSHELEIGNHTLSIPLEFIYENYYFIAYDQRNSSIFLKKVIPSLEPNVYMYLSRNNIYQIGFSGPSDHIIDLDLYIKVEGFAAIIESFENIDLEGNLYIEFEHDFDSIDRQLEYYFVVTYIAYGKEVTVEMH